MTVRPVPCTLAGIGTGYLSGGAPLRCAPCPAGSARKTTYSAGPSLQAIRPLSQITSISPAATVPQSVVLANPLTPLSKAR